ncbi:hypothetical protein P3C98_23550 [Pseudomonas aeruginosa]|uniref:hypothetical protein n=1 Tax=Pseudomonas aeruginosa TaxID=287 RepID=UPI0024980A59|nr:hypothetical protein [Pseudomonas aeruginosa]MDI2385991.1 hypothetical protein [Pseudomonas aeruginosa]
MNKANECTCPSGDGSLVHPCPAHPAVEQAGGDERAKFEYWASDEGIYPKAVERSGNCYKLAQTQSYWMAWQARAALAQPSPVPVSNIEFARKLFEEMALIADDEKCIRMLAGALTQSSPAQAGKEGSPIRTLYTAPTQARHSVPEGWMLVPVEPLLNMMSDKDHDTRITAERQLLSILAAAPGKEGV